MAQPDFLVCLECDSPCYTFEWRNDKPYELLCGTCGNEDPDLFVRPEDVDELDMDWNRRTSRSRSVEESTRSKR
ncbi:MAG TPA: hypothetical protein VNB06_13595 [Thermoanaerobaculia bacterium]|nr:hypothetical protein [Thermoanaerobaculia bacterium]